MITKKLEQNIQQHFITNLSSDKWQSASIKCFTDESHSWEDDSNNLVTILESTGKSAITAVVITELFSEDEFPVAEVVRAPPVTGFNPRIQTRCCSVWKDNDLLWILMNWLIFNLFHWNNLSPLLIFIYWFGNKSSRSRTI